MKQGQGTPASVTIFSTCDHGNTQSHEILQLVVELSHGLQWRTPKGRQRCRTRAEEREISLTRVNYSNVGLKMNFQSSSVRAVRTGERLLLRVSLQVMDHLCLVGYFMTANLTSMATTIRLWGTDNVLREAPLRSENQTAEQAALRYDRADSSFLCPFCDIVRGLVTRAAEGEISHIITANRCKGVWESVYLLRYHIIQLYQTHVYRCIRHKPHQVR